MATARKFHAHHGHLNVVYVTRYAGFGLGRWLMDVRSALRRNEIPQPLVEELDAMGMGRDPLTGPKPR